MVSTHPNNFRQSWLSSKIYCNFHDVHDSPAILLGFSHVFSGFFSFKSIPATPQPRHRSGLHGDHGLQEPGAVLGSGAALETHHGLIFRHGAGGIWMDLGIAPTGSPWRGIAVLQESILWYPMYQWNLGWCEYFRMRRLDLLATRDLDCSKSTHLHTSSPIFTQHMVVYPHVSKENHKPDIFPDLTSRWPRSVRCLSWKEGPPCWIQSPPRLPSPWNFGTNHNGSFM